MALDHGTRKLGIAFSDALEILSSPYAVWPWEGETTLVRLARLAREEGAEALLVGLPRHKDGQESATAPAARAFGEALQVRTGLPLAFRNEHLTTAEASRLLAQRGVKPKDRAARLDAAAAAVLLSEHLESRREARIPVDEPGPPS